MSKETAFYPRLKALTDEWMDLFGYWAPTVVTDTEEEYRAVRETAGLMDFTMLRKVDIEGEGAQDFVNSMVTSILMRAKHQTVRYIKTVHNLDLKTLRLRSDASEHAL